MNIHKFPTLYDTDKMGRVRTYFIEVTELPTGAVINITHGLEDGAKQVEVIDIKTGKNIGRSNETTPFEQAKMDAQSKWNLKQDKGYTLVRGDKSKVLLPMLAQNIDEREHYIIYPAYTQPKLNGMRGLSFCENGKIRMQSRGGKDIQRIPHIESELLLIMKNGSCLDGELYAHNHKLQQITSAINNIDHPEKAKMPLSEVKYYVYDCPDIAGKMSFEERFDALIAMTKNKNLNHIVIVPTKICYNKDSVNEDLRTHIANGYEGVMIRNAKGKYTWGERSNDLQKYKLMQDAEYKIIGVKAGTGRFANAGIFSCITPEGKTFDVSPEGDMELKREYLVNSQRYVGKMLTVRFQEFSEDKIPIFPVGVTIRDYE